MSEAPRHAAGDEGGDLDALRELMSGTHGAFRTVQATYRTWCHEQRMRDAFRADSARRVRRGTSTGIVASAVHTGGHVPAETEETVRIWRDGQRSRQEHHGGWRDGSYSIADGARWWSWSEQNCSATSNQDDPSITSRIGNELQVVLDPSPLVRVLDFQVIGRSQVSGRSTITVHASPRRAIGAFPRERADVDATCAVRSLGIGADSYRLEIDRERGVLLASTGVHSGQPFYTVTTRAIRFDEPIPAETFQFTPPDGQRIRSPRELPPRPQPVSMAEARRHASFSVLVPDPVPDGWQQLYCMFDDASAQSPAHALMNYRCGDGRRSFAIWQADAADASRHHENVPGDGWYEAHGGAAPIEVRPAGEWLPAQARLTRNGTFARLSSQSLDVDELVSIAASLRPAPGTGGGRWGS